MRQVYADVLLTDVSTPSFRSTLPMSLDAFCSHLERRTNEGREAMQEFWHSDAAGLVGQYVGPLVRSMIFQDILPFRHSLLGRLEHLRHRFCMSLFLARPKTAVFYASGTCAAF